MLMINEEWQELKIFWKNSLFHFTSKDMWKFVLKTNNEKFPNLSHLFEVLLILPISNAIVERGFSFMGRIKTECKNHLEKDTLVDLLPIKLEGRQLQDFSPDNAVNVFFFLIFLNIQTQSCMSKEKKLKVILISPFVMNNFCYFWKRSNMIIVPIKKS